MKIVVGADLHGGTLDKLRAAFPAVEFAPVASAAEQAAAVPDADAYLGRISREGFLAAGPRLRWVHSGGAGVEGLASIPELVASQVTVTNTRGGHAPCIADHTMGLLLALTRRLPALLVDQAEEVWRRPGVTNGMRALTDLSMVIVGMGNIGRAIAARAAAFDMRLLGVDLKPGPAPAGVDAIWPLDRLDEALAQADVVAIATPSTSETRGLLDARRIGLIRAGGYLLALSRGGIVDEPALIAALASGHLAGAGLDVTAVEPLPAGNSLWKAPNIIITPHSSGASTLTNERVWSITRENVRRFIADESLENICDLRAGF